jgi:hypothetical protein
MRNRHQNVEIVCIAFCVEWFRVMRRQLISRENRPSMTLKKITAKIQVRGENNVSLLGEKLADYQGCRLKAKINDILRGKSQSDVCFRHHLFHSDRGHDC